jgi:hypothetical protein
MKQQKIRKEKLQQEKLHNAYNIIRVIKLRKKMDSTHGTHDISDKYLQIFLEEIGEIMLKRIP